ncbi:AMP-binding protein [Saccharothrix sp. NPDC042600]|uniref:AMP-binding protein n=1 Tax=Saccharothrix TaxID=2071 RepID=UPI0033C3658B|nr:hypothetical protein GCM10017745_58330 [Saccharothrix mutabilis subsp. capreolus]
MTPDPISDADRVLGWLDDPAGTRGVRFRQDDGSWRRTPYPELADLTLRAGAALADAGVRPGQVVPLVLPNGLDFVTHFFGLLAIGATPSVLPLPWTIRAGSGYADHLRAILDRLRPDHVVVGPAHREVFHRVMSEVDNVVRVVDPGYAEHARDAPRRRGDLAVLQFTSGSRGNPRGLRITTANLAANLRAMQEWMRLEDHGAVSWLPTYHDMGLVGTMLAHTTLQLEHAVLRPEHFLRDPRGWLAEYGRAPYAAMVMPNFGFDLLLARVGPQDVAGLDFSGLRCVVSGAERVDPAVLSRFHRLLEPHGLRGDALMPAYGLAECTLAVTGRRAAGPPRLVRTGVERDLGEKVDVRDSAELTTEPVADPRLWQVGCGRPLDGVEVGILDDDGVEQPEGVVGEILVRGPSVAAGYLDAAPEDAARFTAAGFRTGDAGFLLDGELYVIGRLGDSVKVNGQNVFMEDVELELVARDLVSRRNAVVVAGVLRSTPTVLVVTERPLAADAVPATEAAVRALTGDGVTVRVLHVRSGSIPRTSSGKPRRRALWLAYLSGELAQVAP